MGLRQPDFQKSQFSVHLKLKYNLNKKTTYTHISITQNEHEQRIYNNKQFMYVNNNMVSLKQYFGVYKSEGSEKIW